MATHPGRVSKENQSTFIAVTFVLALVSLAFNFYTFERLNRVSETLRGFDVAMEEAHMARVDDLTAKVQALEDELEALREAAPEE